MFSCAIKQLEERHVSHELTLLVWSDRMDILAIANIKGEVYLHRLNWQRVWYLPPPENSNGVQGMAWRPDGKVICVAYKNGDILLVDVESKGVIHSKHLEDCINCVVWLNQQIKVENSLLSEDDSSAFLPDLPDLSWSTGSINKQVSENLVDKDNINILLIGTKSGILHVSVFGLFVCAVINISSVINEPCSILTVYMSNNLNTLYVLVSCLISNEMKIVFLDTSIIMTHAQELHLIAYKHGLLINLMSYLEGTINSIVEAWETILLEMDSKLSKYASTVPEGAVSADFLELLVFGIPSDEMESFLLQDLTEKGLKKLGHSIELSYSNIQKFVLKHISKVGQSIIYHLGELRGMARFPHRFDILGLEEDTVTNALSIGGSFMVKGAEVQQVIDHSMRNYKAFFRWLYVVILRLTDEQVPAEVIKMTQQDLTFISEFLQNFDSTSEESRKVGRSSHFNLERLGQYLVDSNLTIPTNAEINPWDTFLTSESSVLNDKSIIIHNHNLSLIQEHRLLVNSINKIFEEPKLSIGQTIKLNKILKIMKISNSCNFKLDFINVNDEITFLVFLNENNHAENINLVELRKINNKVDVKFGCLYFQPNGQSDDSISEVLGNAEPLKIIDVKFYTVNILSVLLKVNSDRGACLFAQIPLSSVREYLKELSDLEKKEIINCDTPKINAYGGQIQTCFKVIDNMIPSQFAVSGSRKVSVILSENKRKLHLFEMEADEDEDEEDGDVTTSTARESENSVVDQSMVE